MAFEDFDKQKFPGKLREYLSTLPPPKDEENICTWLQPFVFRDGDYTGIRYGENMQIGVQVFGKTVEEACQKFEDAWFTRAATP